MESVVLCLSFVIAFFVSVFIIFYFNQKSHEKLPPGTTGWPILGENLRLASSGPEKFIEKRMKMYSEEVFKTSLVGEKMAVFCGAAGNKFLFTNENNLLTTWWPDSFTKPVMTFPSLEGKPLKDITAKSRKLVEEILKPEALKRYIPVMDSMARSELEMNWAPFQEVKVYFLSKKYTFSLACRLFLGIEDPELVKSLLESFNIAVSGMFSIPIDFPGTGYNRAMKGGKILRDKFLRIIKERKKELLQRNCEEGFDCISSLLLKTDENGCFITEEEIVVNIIGLLIASYETTSSAVSFVLNYLAEFPDIYDKVYKEILEIANAKDTRELLNWNDIRKMKFSWNVACETLRLTPPAQGAFREATTDFSYAGFRIPKGWKTFWNVYSTHKNPKYFPEPEKFDPSRFVGNGPFPYTFVPFGGGSRMCPGMEYARQEILVFVYNVVKRFKLEKTNPDEKVMYHSSPIPQNGLPIRLLPH